MNEYKRCLTNYLLYRAFVGVLKHEKRKCSERKTKYSWLKQSETFLDQ